MLVRVLIRRTGSALESSLFYVRIRENSVCCRRPTRFCSATLCRLLQNCCTAQTAQRWCGRAWIVPASK